MVHREPVPTSKESDICTQRDNSRRRDGMSEYVPSQRKEPSTSRRVSPHGMSCKSASQHTAASASSIH